MNRIIEIAAMLLGGLSLFAVSFAAFVSISGTPIHEVAGIGRFFSPPEQDDRERPPLQPQDVVDERPMDERSDEEVVEASLGVMGTWSLPSPYTRRDLEELTQELKGRRLRQDEREADLERREQELETELELVSERFETLDALQVRLDEYRSELELRELEVQRDEHVASETRSARWRAVAGVIANLEDGQAGGRLAEYEPEQAALVLAEMEASRAADLLNQIPGERWKEYVEAYTVLTAGGSSPTGP